MFPIDQTGNSVGQEHIYCLSNGINSTKLRIALFVTKIIFIVFK